MPKKATLKAAAKRKQEEQEEEEVVVVKKEKKEEDTNDNNKHKEAEPQTQEVESEVFLPGSLWRVCFMCGDGLDRRFRYRSVNIHDVPAGKYLYMENCVACGYEFTRYDTEYPILTKLV